MLQEMSEGEIQGIISNIVKNTGADEALVRKTLSRLTQFSSYSQLKHISSELKRLGIEHVKTSKSTLSLSNVMYYLCHRKKQLQLATEGNCRAYFLDNSLIKYFEDLKANSTAEFSKILDDIMSGKTKLLSIDGWNAEIDGKDVSYSLFGHSESLEDIGQAVVSHIQKTGETLDSVLNGSIEKKTRAVFGENVPITTIKNKAIKGNSAGEIASTMRPIYPSAETINAVIDTIINTQLPKSYTPLEVQRAKELLSMYYDDMISCFSQENLTTIMKHKYSQIAQIVQAQGRTMKDVVYVIPRMPETGTPKSFELMTYQYAKANKLDPSKTICYTGELAQPPDLKGKTFVVLDDIVGSGESIIKDDFNYSEFFKSADNTNVIFSPVSSLIGGLFFVNSKISRSGRIGTDVFLPSIVVDYNNFSNKLTHKEKSLLGKVMGYTGFANGHACTAMPYMSPDNNTMASSLLSCYFLNSSKGSKERGWYSYFNGGIAKKAENFEAQTS